MQRKPREVPIAGLIAVVPTALTPGQRCCKLVEDPSSSVSAAACTSWRITSSAPSSSATWWRKWLRAKRTRVWIRCCWRSSHRRF